ncbi:pirin family protein [Agitococcus lubricus]|uniref:Pirin N-terminal domain-containing protein n=1 Tax=Agitococcus lubricus TaxID=1077255 RepID=A0A2T5IV06_9GAMM|nr:pirin-like bicupin family protein [Agitococcus lubricus]PTQ87703.1 hypothetical protein C8N29_11727 [Agitococcus lubricus]
MLSVHRHDERGHAHYGWLNARYSFSFAAWHDCRHMGISHLRVLNEDKVKPHSGFARHSHDNMEILTYVLAGAVSHEDSMGNQTTIRAGECQLMSAGTGISHSEMNRESSTLHMLQIWLYPHSKNTTPRYQQIHLTNDEPLQQIAAPEPMANAMHIQQDAAIYRLKFKQDQQIILPRQYINGYLHLIQGGGSVNQWQLATGDALKVEQHEASLVFHALADGEALWFDLS